MPANACSVAQRPTHTGIPKPAVATKAVVSHPAWQIIAPAVAAPTQSEYLQPQPPFLFTFLVLSVLLLLICKSSPVFKLLYSISVDSVSKTCLDRFLYVLFIQNK